MKRPKLRLVKGFATVSQPQGPPDKLAEAIDRFLLSKAALARGTQIQYRQALNHYRTISPEWPPTAEGVTRFITRCQGVYTKETVFSYWSVVRGFVRFLYRLKVIDHNPLEEVTPPRRPVSLPRSPPAENVKRLVGYLEMEVERVLTGKKRYPYWGWREARNLALYSLFIASGLRNNEAANVRLEDIDLVSQFVFVREAKGSKQRYVPFGDKTRADLRLWLDYRALIPMLPDTPGRDYLFISRRTGWRPMATANIEGTLERICLRAEITPILDPHDLRHFFAYECHRQGIPLEQIRRWLGHNDIATTARYTKGQEGLKEYLAASPRDQF